MSRRRYATTRAVLDCVARARAAGITPAAIEFKPNGALVISSAPAPTLDTSPGVALDPDQALDAWLGRAGGAHGARSP